MTESSAPAPVQTPAETPEKKKKPLWRRLLKWVGITLLTVALLLALAISAVVFYLSPERLTPLVNRYASEYLRADVNAGRVELTFWSTFPRLNLEVENLQVVSRSLDVLPDSTRRSLPADADSLLSLRRFSGGVNMVKLLANNVELYDVELSDPRVNLLVVNDSVNNFDIVPPSEPSEESTPMPHIAIDRFELKGDLNVRYRMPADSLDVMLTLSRTMLGGNDAPTYVIGIAGDTDGRFGALSLPPMPFSIDGRIDWDFDNPTKLGLNDFHVVALDVPIDFSTDLNFADTLSVDRLDLSVPDTEVGRLIKYVPEPYVAELRKLSTDLTVGLSAKLLQPYRPMIDSIPHADIDLRADASRVRYDKLDLHRLSLDASLALRGDDLNRAEVTLRRLAVAGKAMEFTLEGDANNLIRDPRIKAKFSGSLAIDRLPSTLMSRLPMKISGTLRGDATARFNLSHLTPKRFHLAKIDGKLTLSNFLLSMHDGSMDADARCVEFNLGTSSKFDTGDHIVDSLLTASLRVDTATFSAPGLRIAGSDLRANLGMRNVASSSDTTQINPIGGTIKVGMLAVNADDGHTRLKFHQSTISGALRRYDEKGKSPLINAHVDASRISARTKEFSGTLRGTSADLEMHPRARKAMPRYLQSKVDSLAVVYPSLTADSLIALARKEVRWPASDMKDDGRSRIDFGVDKSFSSWMRLWDVSGQFTTKSARAFTPHFPVRNRLSNVDVAFSVDSVLVRDVRLQAGHSDFRASGAVRNIRRSLTSRRGLPLDIEFNLMSDTLDVNDLTATLLRGAAYSKAHADSIAAADLVDDDIEDLKREPVATAVEGGAAALLIPSNVNARLSMRARNIHYGDLWLKNFVGGVNMFDGAVALEELRASTDMGSIDMTALYSAPTVDDIRVACGLRLSNLNLHHLLSEMPQLDSLLPMLRSVEGIVNARLALTADFDSLMNLDFNSVDLALQLQGDSLVLLDSETFRTVAKWMMFKNKHRNMIDHMDVEITVHDGWVDLYPVIFDMDRYRLGVMGNNDMKFNLDYHVAVLKSPLPFKFGINIKGTPEKLKIGLGKARLNERSVASTRHITDSLRVNLIAEMSKVFRKGVRTAGSRGLRMQQAERQQRATASQAEVNDVLSAADSLVLIQEGIIEAPQGFQMPGMDPQAEQEVDKRIDKNKKKKKKK